MRKLDLERNELGLDVGEDSMLDRMDPLDVCILKEEQEEKKRMLLHRMEGLNDFELALVARWLWGRKSLHDVCVEYGLSGELCITVENNLKEKLNGFVN